MNGLVIHRDTVLEIIINNKATYLAMTMLC